MCICVRGCFLLYAHAHATVFLLFPSLPSPAAALQLYTPEVYPTKYRATGFGVATMLSRIGSIVAPLLGGSLVASGHLSVALGVFGSLSALACFASLLLRFETTGRSLGEGVHVPGESWSWRPSGWGSGPQRQGARPLAAQMGTCDVPDHATMSP